MGTLTNSHTEVARIFISERLLNKKATETETEDGRKDKA